MKTYISRVSLFFFISFFMGLFSNAQDCYWVSHAGGTSWDGADRMTIDKYGNTYIAGSTQSDYCYFQTDTIHAGENNALFIVKYDNNGKELWVKEISGGNPYPGSFIEIGGLKHDSISGCLLVNGTFWNMATFGDTVLTGLQKTIFILKMNVNGGILWARAAGGLEEDRAFDITSDDQGNVYMSGSNQYPATFGSVTVPPGGFLAKYDPDGNLIWAKNKFRPKNATYFTEASPNNLLIVGQQLIVNGGTFNTTIVVDSISIINSLSSVSNFLASFNLQGDVKWIRLVGQSAATCGSQISKDKSNNIFLTGIFNKTGIFGTDTLKNDLGLYDCFIAKDSINGAFQWVRQLNSTNEAWGKGLNTDTYGNVYLSGFFKGSAIFGNTTLISKSLRDMFLAHFTNNGEFIGVRQYGKGMPCSVSVDSQKNVYFSGEFEDTFVMGPTTFPSWGKSDLFTTKCSQITGVEELKTTPQNQLLIYANPNTGKCTITIPEEFANEKDLVLQIFDLQGKLIQQSKIEIVDGKIKLDIQAQAKGMYTAVLSNGKKSYTGKIVFE
jgi:hypothetical protein